MFWRTAVRSHPIERFRKIYLVFEKFDDTCVFCWWYKHPIWHCPWTYVSTMCVARGINSVWNNKKKQWKKNNKQKLTPKFVKISIFFRASKIKLGLVDFHGLLARLACGLKSFSWRLYVLIQVTSLTDLSVCPNTGDFIDRFVCMS
jgi:hypothetical protein